MVVGNIKKYFVLHNIQDTKISHSWDKIDIQIPEKYGSDQIQTILSCVFGISHILRVEKSPLTTFEDIFSHTLAVYKDQLKGKTFAVRVHRSGNHEFSSMELERWLWAKFIETFSDVKVNLTHPQVEINLSVIDKEVFVTCERIAWAWGFPIGFQDKVLSLISWGFDSTVASYLMMKRGVKMDYLFFNMGWDLHEIAVKQMSYFLYLHYWIGYSSNFVTMDFAPVIAKLIEFGQPRYRSVLLKRYMLRIASRYAWGKYYALVKWDSLWQVSSQTLKNISLIDKASEVVVMRPLISHDKNEIMDIARKIGTYELCEHLPEFCWVVSDKPTTGAKQKDVIEQEALIGDEIVDEVITWAKVVSVEKLVEDIQSIPSDIEVVDSIDKQIVIDIRTPDMKKHPGKNLIWKKVLEIPFYELEARWKSLDETKQYALYCNKWVMSKIHAISLERKGYKNVVIYRPKQETL